MLKLRLPIFYDWLTQESFGELVQRKRQEWGRDDTSMTDNDGNEILAARFAKLLNIAHEVAFSIILIGFGLWLLWIWAFEDNKVAVFHTIILIISSVIAYFVFVLTIGFFATIVSINRRLIEIRDISKKRLK